MPTNTLVKITAATIVVATNWVSVGTFTDKARRAAKSDRDQRGWQNGSRRPDGQRDERNPYSDDLAGYWLVSMMAPPMENMVMAMGWPIKPKGSNMTLRQVKYFRMLSIWLGTCQAHIKCPRKYSQRYRAFIALDRQWRNSSINL